jgi:hypothetical protein
MNKIPGSLPSPGFHPVTETTLSPSTLKSIISNARAKTIAQSDPHIRNMAENCDQAARNLNNFALKKRVGAQPASTTPNTPQVNQNQDTDRASPADTAANARSTMEDNVHKKYDGNVSAVADRAKAEHAQNFLNAKGQSVDDKKGLERIIQHRNILSSLGDTVYKGNGGAILSSRVNELTSPNSNNVVHLENGGASFSFPGGCKGHAVTHEIKTTVVNGETKYFYVLHNRGFGASDEIHGKLSFKNAKGEAYIKSSVAIEVTKEMLTQEFFDDLIQARSSDDMKASYNCLREHLLNKGGKVQVSKEEEAATEATKDLTQKLDSLKAKFNQLKELKSQLTNGAPIKEIMSQIDQLIEEFQGDKSHGQIVGSLKEFKQQLDKHSHVENSTNLSPQARDNLTKRLDDSLKFVTQAGRRIVADRDVILNRILGNDSSFHSAQAFGTCSESNRTGPEKDLASKKTRQQLKLFTIDTMIGEVQKTHSNNPQADDLLKLAQERRDQLSKKIG